MAQNEPVTQIADTLQHQEHVAWKWLVAFLALALLRGAIFAIVVPPWQHPDEPTHFEHVRIIAETGILPGADYGSLPIRREIVASMVNHGFWRDTTQPQLDDKSLSAVAYSPLGVFTLTQPKLYYILAALWLRPWLGSPVDFQLYVVRALSVLLNLLVVTFTFYTSRVLFPGRVTLLIAIIGLVVFHPGYTDIMSAVNNDVLVNTFSAGFFLATAWLYMRRISWGAVFLAVLCLVGAMLSKSTSVVVLCAAPVGAILFPWRGKVGITKFIGVVALGIIALAIISILLSQADIPLVKVGINIIGQYFRIDVLGTWQALTGPGQFKKYLDTGVVVFQSFWVAFGWGHVVLKAKWFYLLILVSVGATAGILWQGISWLRRSFRSDDNERRLAYLIFATSAFVIACIASIMRSQAVQGGIYDYHSNGRYIFVSIVPFALLFTLGLRKWLISLLQQWWFAAYLIALIGLNALAFWGYLVPHFY